MSRHDPTKPPWLRPQAVRLWKAFRAEHQKDWEHKREKIHECEQAPEGEFCRYGYMPEPLFFRADGFKSFRDRQGLDWKDERYDTPHGKQYVPTTRWEEGPFKVVVRQIPYGLEDYSTYGKFTDSPEVEYYGKTWGTMLFLDPILKKQLATALKKEFGFWVPPAGFEGAWDALKNQLRKQVSANYPKILHHRTLKGPDSRHAWRIGVYDTFQGKETHPDRYKKYRYIQLYEYNYDELREWYWLMGRTKREADELARQEFRARVEFMERIAKGEIEDTFVQAKIYLIEDEDEEDKLADAGTSTTIDHDFKAEKRYLDEVARQSAQEALGYARKHVATDDTTLRLPGVP